MTGLLWSPRVAALSVAVAERTLSGQSLPAGQNEFEHITLWTKAGAAAVEANDLPQLEGSGGAWRVTLESPVTLQGVVSLWERARDHVS